jgi:hypothetical protein
MYTETFIILKSNGTQTRQGEWDPDGKLDPALGLIHKCRWSWKLILKVVKCIHNPVA